MEGARSLPLARGFVVMLRAYVDTVTGVGPAPESMIMFRTLTTTPKAEARPKDYRATMDNEVSCQPAGTGQLLAGWLG